MSSCSAACLLEALSSENLPVTPALTARLLAVGKPLDPVEWAFAFLEHEIVTGHRFSADAPGSGRKNLCDA